MNIAAILGFGFLLGMRHATDADHVVAVSAIISRERTLRAAAPIGVLWGAGHTITLLVAGGAIIIFSIVIPPYVGLAMELCVALMLMLLGGLNVRAGLREARAHILGKHRLVTDHVHADALGNVNRSQSQSMRPLFVGVVHGLAGSAAIALLVLGVIRNALWAACYLLVFGLGTIAGMLLITTAMALPIAAAARRFGRLHRVLGLVMGLVSVSFGSLLVYDIGFVHGLFSNHPQWTPQ